ncbi:unnamed protein product [Meloidogyne enterolobii]|uniref:Uncharacterized protein n=1 Tax=Meloidogyne enterolobii TaxID=390850 RepID=A0ACB0Y5Z7_MELEN
MHISFFIRQKFVFDLLGHLIIWVLTFWGACIFVTEYGTVDASGGGGVDQGSTQEWYNFLDSKKISNLNWAISNKAEGAAALTPGTTSSQVGNDDRLTTSGRIVKNYIKSKNTGF